MKTFTIVAMLLLVCDALPAQEGKDLKAKAILDEVSKKNKGYASLKADFSYILKGEGVNEKQEGSITVKGSKYKLNMAGQEVICNGSTMWTIIKEESGKPSEVQISDPPDPRENPDVLDPTTIFTLYEKGFKYRFVEEKTEGGKTLQIIDLYPEKASEKSYHTIRLSVDKAKAEMHSITIKSKDGNQYIYLLNKLTPNVSVSDADFSFDKSKHPGVEIIDMR